MKKAKKITSILMAMILTLLFASLSMVITRADEDTNVEASDRFVTLYTQLFEDPVNMEVFDLDGNCVTQDFLAEYTEYYKEGKLDELYVIVAKEGYSLQYGEAEVLPDIIMASGNVTRYAYSPWKYEVRELNQLVSGKKVEYSFRVKGEYVVSPASQIVSYNLVDVEHVMTYPGTLFSYTTWYTDTTTGGPISVSFGATIYFQFKYSYSTAVYQTISSASYRAVGDRWY